MVALAELVIALADLVEAEAIVLRRTLVGAALAVASTCGAVLLAFVGAGLGLWGLYLALTPVLSPALATLTTSVAVLATAAAVLLMTRRIVQ